MAKPKRPLSIQYTSDVDSGDPRPFQKFKITPSPSPSPTTSRPVRQCRLSLPNPNPPRAPTATRSMARLKSSPTRVLHLASSLGRGRRSARTKPESSTGVKKCPEKVTIAGRELTATVLLKTFFYWMSERHKIHECRLRGEPPPWTQDKILQDFSFVNVFRVYDRVSQYLIQKVINQGDQSHIECCFRVTLFRLFNRIETWELLVKNFGSITLANFDVKKYERVLRKALEEGHSIYTSSYFIPAPKLVRAKNYVNHLLLLKMMMDDDLPGGLLRQTSFREAYDMIWAYRGMGPFLSYQ